MFCLFLLQHTRLEMLSPSCRPSHSRGQLDVWSDRCIVGRMARTLSGRMDTSRPLTAFFSTVASTFCIAQTHTQGHKGAMETRDLQTGAVMLLTYRPDLAVRLVSCCCSFFWFSLHRCLKWQQHLGLVKVTLKDFGLQHLATRDTNTWSVEVVCKDAIQYPSIHPSISISIHLSIHPYD